jgi:SAM-dependent methyltransferase
MHPSVMSFLRDEVREQDITGKTVLEIGSQDVNGSPRDALFGYGPASWVGVDMIGGKGVDVVLSVEQIPGHFPTPFDVVISTEMLEHAQDWRTAVRVMKQMTAPGGLLVVTTRGPGFPFHGYPHDYWRFTIPDFMKIFADMNITALHEDAPGFPGVLMKARKQPTLVTEVDLSKIEVAPVR